jgi:hypothetical protein
MKLYHGSNTKVIVPDLSISKPFKDFGKGFYLSDNYEQAYDMATQKVKQTLKGEPIVSEFQFDESLMHSDELSIKIFSDYTEEWAHFILDNRNKDLPQPIHQYDIVYGPIADDGVTFQLRRYQGGVISLARLVEELKYAKGITFQYYFGSERALQKLTAL